VTIRQTNHIPTASVTSCSPLHENQAVISRAIWTGVDLDGFCMPDRGGDRSRVANGGGVQSQPFYVLIEKMSMERIRKAVLYFATALLLLAAGVSAQAEVYVAGQVGVTLPQDLSKVQYNAVGGNNLALQDSLMYGAKAGYYFDSMKFHNFNLGVETEVFNTNPNIKQQNYTIGGVNLGTRPGVNARILTWAPVNIVVRYQAGAFEPYAGVGIAVFFSHFAQGGSSSSATDGGPNTQLGLRYRVTDNVALFGEWKYNHANLNHSNFLGTNGLHVTANYNASLLAFGVGYHF
jgi:opacity protein-like surface antigen